MPTYGYRCGECGHELEVFQSMSEAPLRACPKCGGPLSKLLYPVGVHFKGSGFYSTDYKSNGGGQKEDQPKDEAKSDSKSESKSESKGEASPSKEKPSSSEAKPESPASKE
jgi:putative FmdB family regulatory protein